MMATFPEGWDLPYDTLNELLRVVYFHPVPSRATLNHSGTILVLLADIPGHHADVCLRIIPSSLETNEFPADGANSIDTDNVIWDIVFNPFEVKTETKAESLGISFFERPNQVESA